ncbi:MAG: 1-(5-phosphoribosyl)-5-[(5-phosphoribosylamino)methylideneamino]imidazole-4-carboxamide isomerase [Clostridia bacterium]|nr:1-(5-phosphoribosyl)-5-[(5-phosphoribosylamino)methylideneamino]imidazole-4-carboxamide isomerase [Clostridia bacterium]
MNVFPAIDIVQGKAVRLFKGDYAQMTVYSETPMDVVRDFERAGAKFLHIVDLEGAKSGDTNNYETISNIIISTPLFVEVGGGIRSMDVIEKYLSAGAGRVILGTVAVTDERFSRDAVEKYGDKIAVGVDIKDGFVAIKGWTEKSEYSAFDFCEKLQSLGVKTVICTDVSKDGAMQGTNRELYSQLSQKFTLDFIASGGVSSVEDIIALKEKGLYGAIIGKAYYTGAIDLRRAIEEAR